MTTFLERNNRLDFLSDPERESLTFWIRACFHALSSDAPVFWFLQSILQTVLSTGRYIF